MACPRARGPARLVVSPSHGGARVVVLGLSGDLDSGTVLILVRAVSAALARVPPPEVVVLDLTGLALMSGSGARVLHTAHDHAAAEGVSVRIVAAGDSDAGQLLAVSGMCRVLNVYPSRQAALRAGNPADFLHRVQLMWNGR